MKIITACLVAFFVSVSSYGQSTKSSKKMFADTEPQIKKYLVDCQRAWDAHKDRLANTYYDSIMACIVNTYVGNHKFKALDGKTIDLHKMRKPVLLTVSASWCAPCRAEIPALSKVAGEYKDKIDFVVLFWDDIEGTKKMAPLYSKDVFLIPSTKKPENDEHIISTAGFRHIRGFPVNYLIATNKQIVKYNEGAAAPASYAGPDGKVVNITEQQAEDANYKHLKEDAEFLLKHPKG